jgi:DamX protein
MKMSASETSELNNRLDYLISYSSQLVFVCSDKIQQQSQVIESFLADQNEQSDLALLTANELTPLVTYREKLFRQLVSQSQEADFNRPLNQLLASLNNQDGPIFISIFKGEKLPNKLVKELWDLVLQSRFANNKQHLNVLIMGLSDWAESAKLGLRAKSKDQPIILNSQSDIQYTETHEFSDLESLIQGKRNKFAQRIENRQYQPNISSSIYKKWWIAILLGLVFLTIFTGMLGWHYPEKVNAVKSYINTQLSTQEQPVKSSDATEFGGLASTKANQPATKTIKDLTSLTSKPVVKEVNTKDILITDWSTASSKLEEQSNKILLKTHNVNQPVTVKTKLSLEPKQPILVNNLEAQTDTVNDYQIEDKFEVQVKPIAEQKILPLKNVEQVQTDDFLYPDPNMLLALPDKIFLIQIAAMADINILQDFIKDEQLGQQLWLYKTQRYGADWYVLLKNSQFISIEDARAEIINLPDAMLRNTPFIKSIGQIKQEISVSVP